MKCSILLLFMTSVLCSVASGSDDYRSIVLEAKNHTPDQIEVYRQDAEDANFSSKKLMKPYQNDAQIAENREREILVEYAQSKTRDHSIKDFSQHAVRREPMASILIFVSFSMPSQSLESYLRDAKKIHASVVIRGLIDNSFQKTFKRIADLVKASDGDGVELNPIWFKRFGIRTVPVVVVVPERSICIKNRICNKEIDFDMMIGDITLSAALKEIRDRGKLTKDIAQSALLTLQGSSHA